MKKVLVTGAFGFMGRHASKVFSEKLWHVMGIGHGNWSEKEWRAWGLTEWHSADINFTTLMTYAGEPDAIIHCAGGANVSFSMKYPGQDFDRSVNSTIAVLEYARQQSTIPAVVFPSSVAVYGQAGSLPIKENQPLKPVSPYGVHKMVCEQLIASYAQHFGIPACVIRYFSLYGPGLKKQLLWDACNRMGRGESCFFGSGQETRDFLHILDAARLLYQAVDHAGIESPLVNGGSGTRTTIEAVLGEIKESLPNAKPPVFSGSIRDGDPTHHLADITRARNWGWEPHHGIQEGILEYVQWYRKFAAEIG